MENTTYIRSHELCYLKKIHVGLVMTHIEELGNPYDPRLL